MPALQLYSWCTPNGHKAHIMLEELGVAYEVHGVDIGKGEQFEPEFLKISPNNKIPALIDNEGPGGESISIFESGAILIYLAEKFGRFFPTNVRDRYDVLQWVMFQMASIGPMLGQAHHFRAHTDEKIPYAIKRYTNEAHRLYRIMNEHLRNHEYFAAGQYSIADMLIYPWTRSHEKQGIELDKFPDFRNWFEKISARPAV
ncbi:MAG: glutathione S-transferase N-terminal domain-containing protein, partial [Gammaproteobacteria bacterium]|nr:glutathione S-transferase N-terminal domain-containing protein [Gammaproteobacteria bacterium]